MCEIVSRNSEQDTLTSAPPLKDHEHDGRSGLSSDTDSGRSGGPFPRHRGKDRTVALPARASEKTASYGHPPSWRIPAGLGLRKSATGGRRYLEAGGQSGEPVGAPMPLCTNFRSGVGERSLLSNIMFCSPSTLALLRRDSSSR